MGKKKKQRVIDWFARLISVGSLILSIIAIIIQCRQDKKLFGEDIVTNISREYLHSNLEIQLSLRNLPLFDKALIRLPYRYSISNNGNRMSSIIDYEILVRNGEPWEEIQLPSPNQLLIDGKPVSIPINIESGETKSFIMYIDKAVTLQAYDLLDSVKSKNGSIRYLQAQFALAKNGIDIFGNQFEYYESESGGKKINYDSILNLPQVSVKAKTSRNNIIITETKKTTLSIN